MASKSDRVKKKRLYSRIVVPIIYGLLGLWFLLKDNKFILALAFLAFAILWVLFYPLRDKKRQIKHYKNHIKEFYKDKLGKETELKLSKDFIDSKSQIGEGRYQISEIKSLIEIENHYFLKLSLSQAIIIPKTAIKDDIEFRNFIISKETEYINEKNWSFK